MAKTRNTTDTGAVSEASAKKHMEIAYKAGDYDKLQGLVKSHKKTSIAKFYGAILAENGLGQEIDKEEAIKLYIEAFDHGHGVLEAGNYLARLYQKTGQENKAITTYKKVSEATGNPIASAYAKYRLNRIGEKKILDGNAISSTEIHEIVAKLEDKKNTKSAIAKQKADKITGIIEAYDSIAEVDNKYIPGSLAHAKVLYHKSLLLLKLTEYDPARKDANIKQAEEHLLNSAKMGYVPAKAELLNIKASAELAATKPNYLNVIDLCNDSLKLDPKNINAKLLLAQTLKKSCNNIVDSKKYDQALTLLREVLKKDPEHKEASRLRNELLKPLIEAITQQVKIDLASKSADFIPKAYKWNWAIDEELTQKRREAATNYIDSLGTIIEHSLLKQPYVDDQILYSDLDNIKTEASRLIFKKTHETLKDVMSNDAILFDERNPEKAISTKDTIENTIIKKKHVKDRIEKTIAELAESKSKRSDVVVSKEQQDLLNNRALFKKEITEKLSSYHNRCVTLIKHDDVGIIDDSWAGYLGTAAEKGAGALGAFLGPQNHGLEAVVAGWVIKGAADYYVKLNKAALKAAAKKLASIGEKANEELGHSARAEEQFKALANEIERIYGMQIDQVDRTDIPKLAAAATEKMLNHLNNSTTAYKRAASFFSNPLDTALTLIRNAVVPEENTEDASINLLLDGLTQGKARENAAIKKDPNAPTGNGKAWLADDIFEKTAITDNGEEFYKNSKSDPATYGAKYQDSIPNGYSKITDPSFDKTPILKSFKQHEELLKIERQQFSSKQDEEQKAHRASTTSHNFAKEIARLSRKVFTSAIIGLAGMAGIYATGVAAVATSMGLPIVSFVPFAAAIGLTSAMVPPVAIAIAAISIIVIAKSAIDGFTASAEREKLTKTHIRNSEKLEKAEKTPEEIQKEQQQSRAKEHDKKHIKSALYSSALSSKENIELKDKMAGLSMKNIISLKHLTKVVKDRVVKKHEKEKAAKKSRWFGR